MVRGWTFHITGGALCLNFANTVSWRRSARPIERVVTSADLHSWARQVGVITRADETRLNREATRHPQRAIRRLATARLLREAIFNVFAAISEGRQPAAHDLNHLTAWIKRGVGHSGLTRRNGQYRWVPLSGSANLMDEVLWRVALSAEELLTSLDTMNVGQCSGRDCRWLWIDQTRNHSRRWCDMAVCGNRAKARRHYERLTAAG